MGYKISNYTVLRRDGTYNYTHHGGVAICVHSSVPYSTVELNTLIQAVAVRVQLHATVSICNIYSPRFQVLDHQLLENIYLQLPQPAIMLSHFNAYNTLWESAAVDAQGGDVEHFINNHNINIMNNGAPTRISYDTKTAIDLTMCSLNLEAELHWSISTSPGDINNCPILVSYKEVQQGNDSTQKR